MAHRAAAYQSVRRAGCLLDNERLSWVAGWLGGWVAFFFLLLFVVECVLRVVGIAKLRMAALQGWCD